MKYPHLGYGLGLRAEHFEQVMNGQTQMDWFEALAENYMGIPGSGQSPLLPKLLKVRQNFPIVLHCVSTNIGSTDPLDKTFLNNLKDFIQLIEPAWVSDHLCWNGIHGHNTHELLPLPYTEEAVFHVANKINQVQDFLGRRFMIENTSSYISYEQSDMSEWEFIGEIIQHTDCGLLLDINNVFVSSQNHDYDPMIFLNSIPMENVGQIHIAGHDKRDNGLIVDTHDTYVCDEVYQLVKELSRTHQLPSMMAEWDDNIPSLETYEDQILMAKNIIEKDTQSDSQRATNTSL